MTTLYDPNDPSGGGTTGVLSGGGTSSVSYPYIPLLEGKAGKVYIQNPSAPGFYYAGCPGGLGVFNAVGFLGSGALAISANSSSSYQGRIAVAANPLNSDDKKFELQYNGSAWDSTTADNFFINITTHDTAYSDGTNFDLYEFSPGPPPGASDVYTQRRGGSDYNLYVWALSVPTPVTFTPSIIPADGQPHVVTVSLATRLHSSQNPTMQFQLVGTGAPSVTLGSAVPIRNSAGQITGYSISATANNQPSATGTWRLTAFESLTYLKNDVVVTENVPYYTNQTLSATLAISGSTGADSLKVAGSSLRAGSGTDVYWGKLESGVAVPRLAGGIVAELLLTSGTPFGGEVVNVFLKQSGLNSRLPWAQWALGGFTGPSTTGSHVDGTTLSSTGSTLYTRTLYFNIDLGSVGDWSQYDIGYSVSNDGNPVGTGYFNSAPLANGNLIRGANGYNVQLWAGTTVPGEWDSGAWAPSQPTFAGAVTAYLSEHWNAYDTGATTITPFFDTIEYQIDGGAWVSLNPGSFSTAMLASTFSGGGTTGGGGGGGGCVPHGTMVATPSGMAEIQNMREGAEVSGFDEVTLSPVLTTVEEVIRYDYRQLYELKTTNSSLICSHDHRLATRANSEEYVYPAARDLKVGGYIYRLIDGQMLPEQLTEVTPLERYETVFHLKLKDGHVFVAGGFAAHNLKTEHLTL